MKLKMMSFVALSLVLAWNYWAVFLGLFSLVLIERAVDHVFSSWRARHAKRVREIMEKGRLK